MKRQIDFVLRCLGFLALVFIAISLFSRSRAQGVELHLPTVKMKVTGWDVAAIALSGVAGVAEGAAQAYHADPRVFERRWGVAETSFWGSRAWERNYVGNVYFEGADHKRELFGNFGRDVWHTAGDVSNWGQGGAMLTVGLSEGVRLGRGRSKWWHTALKVAACAVVRSGCERGTYNYLRQRP